MVKKIRNKSHLQAVMWSAFPSLLSVPATNTKRELSDDPCEPAPGNGGKKELSPQQEETSNKTGPREGQS